MRLFFEAQGADGRTRAYLCGRSISLTDLGELAPTLLSFYGQHEHRKLMLSAVQLDLLDAHCGGEVLALRERVGGLYVRVRRLEAVARKVAAGEELSGVASPRIQVVPCVRCSW